jgi:Spy/CpxP family protein refolding chaperone
MRVVENTRLKAMTIETPLSDGWRSRTYGRHPASSRCGSRVALAAVALCLLASAAAGQEPGRPQPWWLSPVVQSHIALAPDQAERIDAIFRASLPERRRLRQQATSLRKQLEGLLAAGTMSDVQAVSLISRLCKVEGQRNVARTMMLVRMHRVLTPAQRTQLTDLSVRLASERRSTDPATTIFQR